MWKNLFKKAVKSYLPLSTYNTIVVEHKTVLIERSLVFDSPSTNRIKMNRIKTMLCSSFIWIDILDRLEFLQTDPLISKFNISIKQTETVSHFSENFNFKTTHMLREIHVNIFNKLIKKVSLRAKDKTPWRDDIVSVDIHILPNIVADLSICGEKSNSVMYNWVGYPGIYFVNYQ